MLGFLQNRLLTITALLWVVGFFGVFMPVHDRGIVGLPGGVSVAVEDGESNKPYCPLCMPMESGGKDAPDAPVNCAICHLKVGLDVPPTVILAPHFYDELVFALFELRQTESVSFELQHRIQGRAPPTNA